MSEIKKGDVNMENKLGFRGFDKVTGFMEGISKIDLDSGWGYYIDDNEEWQHIPVQFLMQRIPVSDKKGKPIYESDIIRVKGHIYTVKFVGMGFWFVNKKNECFVFDSKAYSIEIIGNIHQNPELLECNNGK